MFKKFLSASIVNNKGNIINMAEGNICKNCESEMKFVEERIIAGTKYKMFKCEKCNVQVAKSQS